jgi:hypothetical protein
MQTTLDDGFSNAIGGAAGGGNKRSTGDSGAYIFFEVYEIFFSKCFCTVFGLTMQRNAQKFNKKSLETILFFNTKNNIGFFA